jgi:hypothetical protein
MNSFLDSKAMAKALRLSLAELDIELSHGACLELVARQFGFSSWNVLSAQIGDHKARRKPLRLPVGWAPTTFTDTTRYRVGLDDSAPGCALIESIAGRGADPVEHFACLMQSIDARPYGGTRLRLAAMLRSEDAGCGTIWMRIDGADKRSLGFDNMLSRERDGPIGGTTGWASRSIVLDVPTEAASIHYGFFLRGGGKVWARSFTVETVCEATSSTAASPLWKQQRDLPNKPVNLDFAA